MRRNPVCESGASAWSHTEFGKSIAAGCELFERTTRRYGKPEWGLHDTEVNGVRTPIEIRSIWERPFCCCCIDRADAAYGELAAAVLTVLMSGH